MKKKNKDKKRQKILASVMSVVISASLFGCVAPVYATPTFFDWRLENSTDKNSAKDSLSIVPTPKNQGYFGTCWAFAAIGSYESSWMKQLKAAKAAGESVNVSMPNFSERYTAWMAYRTATNETKTDTVTRENGIATMSGLGTPHPVYDIGGHTVTDINIFLNKGVVNETDAPYQMFRDDWNEMDAKLNAGDREGGLTIRDKVVQESYGAIENTITPVGLLHDSYRVPMRTGERLTADEIEKVKKLIAENGVITIAHNADDQSTFNNLGEWYSASPKITHAETLVGWDDDYFLQMKDENGETLKGAFIIRNSWGDTAGGLGNGYGYISYQDASLRDFHFSNAELDSARYTINANNAPATVYTIDTKDADGKNPLSQPIASSFVSSQNHFLKGVMLYASADNMPYEILVRNGRTPGVGEILHSQSGTFGNDGTPRFGGFRTVDLNKYVLLPQGDNYTIEVTTTSSDGKAVRVAIQATDAEDNGYEGNGKSYYYDYQYNKWIEFNKWIEVPTSSHTGDTVNANIMAESNEDTTYYKNGDYTERSATGLSDAYVHVFLVGRGKETDSPEGGDFTVGWLDDTGSNHSSVINLGKADEDYAKDAAHPNRKTLSNITVDLKSGILNEYGGTITGEGSVTKTGDGSLILSGNNTHTGLTNVNKGILAINGSIAGDSTVTDTGVLMGNGSIGGELNNKNIVVAGYGGQGTLTVGNLVGDGGKFISIANETDNSKIRAQGTANVANATFLVENALPENDYEVVNASVVTGEAANNINNQTVVSGMMNQYGEKASNTLKVKSVFADNLGNSNSIQRETMGRMNAMYQNLDSAKREEMRTLYNLSAENAKTALSEIGVSPAPDLAYLVQQRSVTGRVVGNRINSAFGTDADNNAWVKFTKHWGDLKSGANYHGQVISGGYDYAIGKNWRIGTFISYNAMGYGAESASGNVYDTRFGFYGGYRKGASDAYVYLDYGWQKNKLRRALMGMTASADYDSHLIELGGEYKYDLHANDGKVWHISPYAGLQLSYLHHNGYNEKGAGIFNQQVAGKNNTYFAMQMGMEFKRYLTCGSYGLRLGISHAFSGGEPNLSFRYEGDAQNRYTLGNNQDKTHFLFNLSANTEFAQGWQIAGDAVLQKGTHDKDLSASITLKRMW